MILSPEPFSVRQIVTCCIERIYCNCARTVEAETMSRRQDRFPFFQSYQSFLPHWDRLPNCTLFLTAHPHARERNLLYLRELWNMDAWRVRESVDFLSLASGRRDGGSRGDGVFGDPEKAGAKLNVSNLAVIQRAATGTFQQE